MLLSTKLSAALKFSAFKLPIVKTAMAAGLGALTWGSAEMVQRPSIGGADYVAQSQAATTQQSPQLARLYDEIQYIGDKFLQEEQQLSRKSDDAVVQAF